MPLIKPYTREATVYVVDVIDILADGRQSLFRRALYLRKQSASACRTTFRKREIDWYLKQTTINPYGPFGRDVDGVPVVGRQVDAYAITPNGYVELP